MLQNNNKALNAILTISFLSFKHQRTTMEISLQLSLMVFKFMVIQLHAHFKDMSNKFTSVGRLARRMDETSELNIRSDAAALEGYFNPTLKSSNAQNACETLSLSYEGSRKHSESQTAPHGSHLLRASGRT